MKKFSVFLVAVVLIGAAGILFFFYHLGSNDAKALTDFPAAYGKFDQAISDFSTSVFASDLQSPAAAGNLEHRTDEALVELNTAASARISSLTRNDGEIMKLTPEIADLSGKEFSALKAYQSAAANRATDLDQLAKEYRDRTTRRRAAYARFLALAGLKD